MHIPNRVLIVGAGPSGLITYRNLAIFGKFQTVQLYERRDDVGGIWYLDNPPKDSTSPRWPSPAYPGLIGNVLPEFLSFSHFPFPHRTDLNQPFPTLDETHAFLRVFAEPYVRAGNMKLNMEVVRVEELPEQQGWRVLTKNWNNGGEEEESFWDAVVIAVGWYDNPVWPDTPGLDILRQKGLANHAKSYRGPQGTQGKCALVVGNANSGNDIAAHLTSIAQTPVYQSIRRPAFPGFPSLPDDRIRMVAPVAKYQVAPGTDKVTAHLADGTILENVDVVHIATGYQPNPGFIHVLNPTTTAAKQGTQRELLPLVSQNPHPTAGVRIPSLHRHILYAYNPSLAFIGAPMSFTPFTISDVSSLWLTYVWGNEILYPSTPEALLEFENARLEAIDKRRASETNPSALFVYSVLGATEEEFAAGLRKDIVDVHPEFEKHLPEWNEKRRVYREGMYSRKLVALEYARDHPGSGIGAGNRIVR